MEKEKGEVMRELTVQGKRKTRMLNCPTRGEQWHGLRLYGKDILYNEDTLRAVLIEDKSESESIGCSNSTKPQFTLANVRTARYVVLNVTHGCNLACKYCFAREYGKMPIMTIALAREAVNKLFDVRSDLNFGFFGGEPLMAWDTVRQTMQYVRGLAKARQVKCKFHITTNATLLTPEIAQVIKNFGCSLLVSLDGPEAIHNEWRPMKNGMDSFQSTVKALELLHKMGMSRRVMLRGTFTPEHTQLIDRFKFAYDLQLKGWCNGFSIEPVNVTEGCIKREAMDNAFPPTFEEEYHTIAEWFLDKLEKGSSPPGFFHFRKLLGRLYRRELSATECGSGRGYLTIAPNGTICACHREAGTEIGHLRLGVDEERRQSWYDNRIYRSVECMKCWARFTCGGGCRQVLAEKGKSFDQTDKEHCRFMKMLIRECLWMLSSMADKTKERYFGATKT